MKNKLYFTIISFFLITITLRNSYSSSEITKLESLDEFFNYAFDSRKLSAKANPLGNKLWAVKILPEKYKDHKEVMEQFIRGYAIPDNAAVKEELENFKNICVMQAFSSSIFDNSRLISLQTLLRESLQKGIYPPNTNPGTNMLLVGVNDELTQLFLGYCNQFSRLGLNTVGMQIGNDNKTYRAGKDTDHTEEKELFEKLAEGFSNPSNSFYHNQILSFLSKVDPNQNKQLSRNAPKFWDNQQLEESDLERLGEDFEKRLKENKFNFTGLSVDSSGKISIEGASSDLDQLQRLNNASEELAFERAEENIRAQMQAFEKSQNLKKEFLQSASIIPCSFNFKAIPEAFQQNILSLEPSIEPSIYSLCKDLNSLCLSKKNINSSEQPDFIAGLNKLAQELTVDNLDDTIKNLQQYYSENDPDQNDAFTNICKVAKENPQKNLESIRQCIQQFKIMRIANILSSLSPILTAHKQWKDKEKNILTALKIVPLKMVADEKYKDSDLLPVLNYLNKKAKAQMNEKRNSLSALNRNYKIARQAFLVLGKEDIIKNKYGNTLDSILLNLEKIIAIQAQDLQALSQSPHSFKATLEEIENYINNLKNSIEESNSVLKPLISEILETEDLMKHYEGTVFNYERFRQDLIVEGIIGKDEHEAQ